MEHPKIEVDGVMKHRHNSNGVPIHHTDEGIKNFHRWFGDSKVVDQHGRPQVVYHGTNAHAYSKDKEIETFHTNPDSNRGGAFFTSNKELASQYGEKVYQTYVRAKNPLIVHGEGSHWTSLSNNLKIDGNITPELKDKDATHTKEMNNLYRDLADMDNEEHTDILPKLHNASSLSGHKLSTIPGISQEEETDTITKKAKKLGYDSVIFKNIKDSPTADPAYKISNSDVFATFHPSQIKSAIGNSGDFSKESNNITESKYITMARKMLMEESK